MVVICGPALAASVFGIGYLNAAHHGDAAAPPRFATDGLVGGFLASMVLVVLADSMAAFLIAWEAMAVSSFLLVIGDGHRPTARRAGYIYLVMTHAGAAFLLVAFLGLAHHAGGLSFDDFRAAAGTLGRWERIAIFVCALVGLGSKMGLIPLHVWLPRAHPEAPSHVSALMSGVMVKLAIYAMIRMIWEFAAPVPARWGELLIVLGAVSAVLGILYALMERDLKRVLAYSTVENVGVITIGLGVATFAQAQGYSSVTTVALVATLLHTLNHSIFKGLLFLGAGAVQTGTGTRDLERLGGLARSMPRTTALFLIGALAAAALPILNGFVGEWFLFQSLLSMGVADNAVVSGTLVAVAAAALALTGALALACFVRAFGIGFLAQARSTPAREAHEVGVSLLAGMGLLAVSALLLGVLPLLALRLLEPVTQDLSGEALEPTFGLSNPASLASAAGSYAPLLVIAGLVVVGCLPWLLARLLTGPGRARVAPTWVCGVRLEPRMQYTATGFAKPIRLIFQAVIRPQRTIELDQPVSRFFVQSVHYEEGVQPIYERQLYQRAVALLLFASRRVRALQSGSTRAYLAYLFVTLLVVLLLTR
jgi:hydrogenase-4 component B